MARMIPKKYFVPIFIVVVGLLTLIESNTDTIDIPLVPDISINGAELPRIYSGKILTHEEVRRELRDLFPYLNHRDIHLSDRTYQEIDHESFKKMVKYMSRFYWNTPSLQYRPESYDCDNFARTMLTLCDLAGAEFFDGQILLLKSHTFQKHEWARIPSGGYHALILVRTTRGWFFYEPQGRHYIEVMRYPNRKHLTKLAD